MGLYDTKTMDVKTMSFNRSYPKVETIAVSNETLELAPKQTQKLTVTFSPEETTQKGLIWTTNDARYATVDSEGNVESVTDGKATIRVTSVEDPSIYDECIVTVATAVTEP